MAPRHLDTWRILALGLLFTFALDNAGMCACSLFIPNATRRQTWHDRLTGAYTVKEITNFIPEVGVMIYILV